MSLAAWAGSGCGGASGGVLAVYSSLPLQGAARSQAEDVVKGIRLALKQRDFRAGGFTIAYRSLDDSTPAAGQWDAAQTKANARRVAQDERAIAYIGELNSGASANSISTLNEAGILQVSPSNTALGLTKAGDGAAPGEPGKYYPTGERTFGRVVPVDTIQGAAQAQFMRDESVASVYVLNDQEVYGTGIAANTTSAAEALGIKVVGTDGWDGEAANFRALADKVRASGAEAVFAGGNVDSNAPQLFKDLHAAAPAAKLFAPDGMATASFSTEIPTAVQRRTFVTSPTVSPDELPAEGEQFYEDFRAEYGEPAGAVDPYAVYGYEAADAVLDSIERGGDDRQAVVDAFFSIEDKRSPLGTYSIDEDGDTTLSTYGAYVVRSGRLVFRRAIRAAP